MITAANNIGHIMTIMKTTMVTTTTIVIASVVVVVVSSHFHGNPFQRETVGPSADNRGLSKVLSFKPAVSRNVALNTSPTASKCACPVYTFPIHTASQCPSGLQTDSGCCVLLSKVGSLFICSSKKR